MLIILKLIAHCLLLLFKGIFQKLQIVGCFYQDAKKLQCFSVNLYLFDQKAFHLLGKNLGSHSYLAKMQGVEFQLRSASLMERKLPSLENREH